MRDFVRFRRIAADDGVGLPKTCEFRTFWWGHTCVSWGRYWTSIDYRISSEETERMLDIARRVAVAVSAVFVVIDMGLTEDGEWLVIEINDGQEAGYAGNNPYFLWSRVLQLL